MDIVTLGLTQLLYERRKAIVAGSREEILRRVKPEHVNQTHKTVARQ